jgi:hypothetical protein
MFWQRSVQMGVLSSIQNIEEVMKEVLLLNFYRSLPFTTRARFRAIKGDAVMFEVEPPTSVCLIGQTETWILGSDFFEALHAQISFFDIGTGTVGLTGFSSVGPQFGNRRVVRVEPADPVAVEIQRGELSVAGRLVNISMNGLRMDVAGVLDCAGFYSGKKVTCQVYLPQGMVSVEGKIQATTSTQNHPCSLSITYSLQGDALLLVMQYIAYGIK